MSIPDPWTADELMHGKEADDAAAAVASLIISPNGSPTSKSPSKRFSMAKMGKKKPPADPMDWGMPGHLTDEEVAIFVSSSLLLLLLLLLLLSLPRLRPIDRAESSSFAVSTLFDDLDSCDSSWRGSGGLGAFLERMKTTLRHPDAVGMQIC